MIKEWVYLAIPTLLAPPEGPNLTPSVPPPAPLLPARNPADEPPDCIQLLGKTVRLTPAVDWMPPGPRLDAMTLHYMEWIEQFPGDQAMDWILDWVSRNPAQAPGARWAPWNAYAISLRSVVWMQAWARHRWEIDTENGRILIGSLQTQLRDLNQRLELDLGGNHLIKNIKALIWGSAFFQGSEPALWFTRARKILERELASQILPDGLHFERSPAYHLQVFADLLEIRHTWPEGVPCPSLDNALDRMAQATVDLTHPDGLPSLFNDGGLHMAYTPAQCLGAYQRLRGLKIEPRDTFAFSDSGYFGVRHGDSMVIWDCGPVGPDHLPAHGHGDMLALEWSLNGHRVLVDMGVLEYEPGPMRSRSRGTYGHNTVTVDAEDQCEFWGSFRLARRVHPSLEQVSFNNGWMEATGNHCGYARLPSNAIHRRHIRTDGRTIELADEILSRAPVQAQATFLLHPDCKPIAQGIFETPAGRVALTTSGDWQLQPWEWFPDFGSSLATQLVVIDFNSSTGPLRTCWRHLP